MYKVTKRDCPMFGIGPYICEFICDTASDISTLPTSISEGTGGKTAYDNQMCASGSIAIVAENGSESKQYMLNNQDIWCPYSVAAGSSGGGSSGSSITVDFALSNTSENPVANKVIVAALDDKANVDDIPNIKVNAAVDADTVNGHSVNADVPENAKFTDTIPDLSPYALKSKYGDTTIDVGRKDGTTVGRWSTAEGYHTTASGDYSHAEGASTTASDSHSHAEGYLCTASSDNSHAEGNNTTASGAHSHAEGSTTTASGIGSHSGGTSSTASGDYSFAHGMYVESNNSCEVSLGKFNKSSSDTRFSIGDGTSDTARHNAFEITTSGGKLHDKDIATTDLIPTTLPANGGNADTLGGKSADDFVQIINLEANQTDTKTAVGTSTKTTIYRCINWTDYPAESPDGQGIIITANYNGAGIAGTNTMWAIQFFISARTGVVYKRYIGDTSVGSWEDCRDGGNADTVDGMHADNFIYPRKILANVDVNTILYPCSALIYGDSTNIPSVNSWGTLLCYSGGTGSHVQIWVSEVGNIMYFRHHGDTSWSEWKEIYTSGNKPYVTGSATVAANTNACVSNHGFTPSAVIWWDGSLSGVAVSFNETQFVMGMYSTTDRTVNYLIFK